MNMFEITPDEIAKLSDADLRDLVGLLCEATLRERHLPLSAVTYGGSQDASDGGLDVRVKLPRNSKTTGFIPKWSTGFQVKKPDLKPSKIGPEMRPDGKLRASIKELVNHRGAYVIVSSAANLTDKTYNERIGAMDRALRRVNGAAKLSRDYYDRKRLTIWVRDHPGLIAWVKIRVGTAIKGWQPFDAWAYPAEGVDARYLLDDKIRIRTDNKKDSAGLSVADAISRLREVMRGHAKVLRIVGLSGVGKTRLVQALFDSRIGKHSLDPGHVFYTNMSDDPDPQPIGLASDLIASKVTAIIVVDNCPSDLHRRLTEVVRKPNSTVSVITVEYDIRDEEHDETDVFRIEPSSDDLIQSLIRGRFKHVSAVDAETIARFSGGNARMAIALANTVRKQDRLTGMSDEDLFKRLFQQRHDPDAGLLEIAQACSLVYSFQGEALDGVSAELPYIAALAGMTVRQVHAAVAELERRDLVQRRGAWRAVLPHAIANRLAKLALQNIPPQVIDQNLTQASERLLLSFSRRLGYLDDSAQAARLAGDWLARGGMLSEIGKLSELGHSMLANIAPLAPKSIIEALKRIPAVELSDREKLARLVRSIAYDAAIFDDSIELLAGFARADLAKEDRHTEAGSCLVSLFKLWLSGTHASVEQRERACERLLLSGDAILERLGVDALEAALETDHFSSSYSFDFGSHSRDYGWQPKTNHDVKKWYQIFLALLDRVRKNVPALSDRMKKLLAHGFRGLYGHGGVGDELTAMFNEVAKEGFWRDGWLAVRQTLKFDGTQMPADIQAKINSLGDSLQPAGLEQKVIALVTGYSTTAFEFEDSESDENDNPSNSWERHESLAFELGEQVRKANIIERLAPDLIRGQGRTFSFGRGLAHEADARQIWSALKTSYNSIPPTERRLGILQGLLRGLHDKGCNLFEALLDEAITDEALGPAFPLLQCAVEIDQRGIARLQECLRLGLAYVLDFDCLASGRATDPIAPADLRDLLIAISKKPDGSGVPIHILFMRAFSDKQAGKPLSAELIDAGRVLLQQVKLKRRRHQDDYHIAGVIQLAFGPSGGKNAFKIVCNNFITAVAKRDIYPWEHDQFVQALFTARPLEALDSFLGSDNEDDTATGISVLESEVRHAKNPLASAAVNDIVQWCDRDPARRYPIIAQIVPLFKSGDGTDWSEHALAVLGCAPDKLATVRRFIERFRPSSWSGSLASIYEARLVALRRLESHSDPAIARVAREQVPILVDTIGKSRDWETQMDRGNDERFE